MATPTAAPSTKSASEKWADIPGYEGYYEVSSLGNVRSLDRAIPHPKYGVQRRKGKPMQPRPDKDGYLSVKLRRDGSGRAWRVHILVAHAFLGKRPEWSTMINHKNRAVADNRVENLEWADASLNQRHRYAMHEYKGTMYSPSQLAEIAGIPVNAMKKRLGAYRWTVECAVETPLLDQGLGRLPVQRAGGDGYCLWVE
jgi:hypothetical protein